jgi:ferric-dicitrate binding protein FerR (iron transport regulator)
LALTEVSVVAPSVSEKVSTEAAIWLARMERGLQGQEGPGLREWLQHPAHRTAIEDAAKLWHGPDIVAVLAQLMPVGFGSPPPRKVRRLRPFHLFVGLCVGLPIAFAVLRLMPGVGFHNNNRAERDIPWGQTIYSTKPGETRAVTLLDGSRVTLNSHTELAVLFAAGRRLATLNYGEAIFQIASQLSRPFEVTAAGRHLQAPPSGSNCRFDVRVIDPQSVELTVLDGGVTVQGLPWHWPNSPSAKRMFDPAAFRDASVGPLQSVLLQDEGIYHYEITAENASARLRWEPEQIIYVTP